MAADARVDVDVNAKGNARVQTGVVNCAGLSNATGVFIPVGIADRDLLWEGGSLIQAIIAGTASATLTFGYAASGKTGLTETTPLSAAVPLTAGGGGAADTLTNFVPLAVGGLAGKIPADARYGFLTNKSITDVISIGYRLKFRESPQ